MRLKESAAFLSFVNPFWSPTSSVKGQKDTGAEGQQLGSVVDELDQSSLGQQAPLDRRDFLHPSWA